MTRRGRAVRAALLLACVLAVVGPAASVASPSRPDAPDRLVDPRVPRDLLEPRPQPAPGVPAPPGLLDPRDPRGPLDPDAGPAPLPLPRAAAGSRPVPMPEADVPDPGPTADEPREPGPDVPGRVVPDGPLADPRLP